MADINRVTLKGRLGRDAEIKTTKNGNCVANLAIATGQEYTDKNGELKGKTEWHRVVFWMKKPELAELLVKGADVFCEGKLETRSWEDQNKEKKYVTEIVINSIDVFQRRPQTKDSGYDEKSEGTPF